MILEADEVMDIGPKAGKYGGEILWQGRPKDLKKAKTDNSGIPQWKTSK